MRENRPYGSEGGGAELNRSSLPLSKSSRGQGPTHEDSHGHRPSAIGPYSFVIIHSSSFIPRSNLAWQQTPHPAAQVFGFDRLGEPAGDGDPLSALGRDLLGGTRREDQ